MAPGYQEPTERLGREDECHPLPLLSQVTRGYETGHETVLGDDRLW